MDCIERTERLLSYRMFVCFYAFLWIQRALSESFSLSFEVFHFPLFLFDVTSSDSEPDQRK